MTARRLRGWLVYSWANHAWETTVSTALAGPWLLALATDHRRHSSVLFSVIGLHLRANAYPSFVLTVAALLKLAVLPSLGARADRWSRPAWGLGVCCVVGSLMAVALAATSGTDYVAAGVLFAVGSIAYGASNVLYNSYLPSLAAPADRDAVSSRGFGYGYLGGGLLLAANLGVVLARHDIDISKSIAVRICFVSAGVWWSSFGLWSLARLSDRKPRKSIAAKGSFGRELRQLVRRRHAFRYLVAYLLFADAISAVISLSSTFLTHELFGDSASRASTFLFALILLIQFVAILGAVGFARLAAHIGTKPALLVSLVVWCVVILYSYLVLRDKVEAVIAGVVIGSVLGGSQALARSQWSQLIPAGRESTYFGLYEVANDGTAWIAPLLFTVVVNVTGSFREAILSLLVLFVAGGGLLAVTDLSKAATIAP